MEMPISKIIVGDRRREDLGDVAGLARSIDKYGLLQPVVVDSRARLVAGERRLRACQRLGMKWIPVQQLDDLSDAQLREIELEENLRRKDLTEYERSRTLVARVEAARDVATESDPLICPNSGQIRARSMKPGSLRDVSQRTGIPRQTINSAQKHVAAVERYPELEPLPQSTAIKAAKELDLAPEESREAARERLRQEKATGERVLSVVAELVPGAQERIDAAALRAAFSKAIAKSDDVWTLEPAAVVAVLDNDGIQSAEMFIWRVRRWLDALETELRRGIRLVASED